MKLLKYQLQLINTMLNQYDRSRVLQYHLDDYINTDDLFLVANSCMVYTNISPSNLDNTEINHEGYNNILHTLNKFMNTNEENSVRTFSLELDTNTLLDLIKANYEPRRHSKDYLIFEAKQFKLYLKTNAHKTLMTLPTLKYFKVPRYVYISVEYLKSALRFMGKDKVTIKLPLVDLEHGYHIYQPTIIYSAKHNLYAYVLNIRITHN